MFYVFYIDLANFWEIFLHISFFLLCTLSPNKNKNNDDR